MADSNNGGIVRILIGAVIGGGIMWFISGVGLGPNRGSDGEVKGKAPSPAVVEAPSSQAIPQPSGQAQRDLVIIIDGEQYIVNGKKLSIVEVVSEAKQFKEQEPGSTISLKIMPSARFLTRQNLENELKRIDVHYTAGEEFN